MGNLERKLREATGGVIKGEAKSRSLLEEVRGGESNRLGGWGTSEGEQEELNGYCTDTFNPVRCPVGFK